MATVVVTGAAGMIGAAVATRFRDRGDAVTGVDLRSHELPGVASVTMDIAAEAFARSGAAVFDGADIVVHAAAIVAEAGDLQRFVAVNVGGTRRVVKAAAAAGVSRVVHLSSVVAARTQRARCSTFSA